jgi:hypothetical protein
MARKTTQTTRINGAKVKIVTGANGKITIKSAPIDEWELQAAAVRALRQLPEYAANENHVGRNSFAIAGDMNAARRSRQESMKAVATGIAAGDPDLRVYGAGGRLLLIEYKNAEGRLTASQKDRHPLLAALGHKVTVIKAKTKEDCAARSVQLVKEWLMAG